MKTLTLFFLIVSIIILNACSSSKTVQDYMSVPESKLCVNYLNNWGYFENQHARLEAIRSRGIDCDQYRELAKSQFDRRESISDSTKELLDGLAESQQKKYETMRRNSLNCTSRKTYSGTVYTNCY